jgi:hypothetical protein
MKTILIVCAAKIAACAVDQDCGVREVLGAVTPTFENEREDPKESPYGQPES